MDVTHAIIETTGNTAAVEVEEEVVNLCQLLASSGVTPKLRMSTLTDRVQEGTTTPCPIAIRLS